MRTATILFLSILSARAVAAEDKSKPGEFITEPATLISLGFEWRIEGDDNRNARVEVSYRKQGEQAWKAAPPLLRIGNERINENALQYVTPNGFAGSVFDLEPATMLRQIEGMSTEEVADALNVSEAVVKTRLSRARSAIRRELFEYAGLAASNTFRFLRPRCDRVVSAVLSQIS